MIGFHMAPPSYDHGCNQFLLRAVPIAARRILDIGCAAGGLGAALKHADPSRQVFGVECRPESAAQAEKVLDGVFRLDIEREAPPLDPASIDAIAWIGVTTVARVVHCGPFTDKRPRELGHCHRSPTSARSLTISSVTQAWLLKTNLSPWNCSASRTRVRNDSVPH